MGSEKMPSVWVVLDPRNPNWSEICDYRPTASAYVMPVRIVEYVPKPDPGKMPVGFPQLEVLTTPESKIREIAREEIGKAIIARSEVGFHLIPGGEK